MYQLPYFTEPDEEVILDFMQKNSFALISGILNEKVVTTHIPIEVEKIDGKIVLSGHIMKGTNHHKAFLENENVLIVFSGAHCYVSASWYEKKAVASTWNYMDVQVQGKIKFTDTKGTLEIIEKITDKYEGLESEATFKSMSSDYLLKNVEAIIGFYIEVVSVENTFKLSQNKNLYIRKNIIANLEKLGDVNSKMIAEEMKKRL
ncbi:MAG: FMN-binding negative transcriptional regulator [Ginsengibacter sp.]